MEYLKSSIAIKDYLLNEFPLPDIALELIINNLKLAVDIDGYTKEMLQYFINNHFKADYTNVCNLLVENIACRKYNKTYSKLNKYELIGVIQHFNINIPIRPKQINYIKNIDTNVRNVDMTNLHIISNNFPIKSFMDYKLNTKESVFEHYVGFSIHYNILQHKVLIIYEYFYEPEKTFNQNNFKIYNCSDEKIINDIILVYTYFTLNKNKIKNFDNLFTQNAYIDLYDKIKSKSADYLLAFELLNMIEEDVRKQILKNAEELLLSIYNV